MSNLGHARCYAWCDPPIHVCIIATSDNPPRWLCDGMRWWKGDQLVEAVRWERASLEHPPPAKRPAGYRYEWLVWFRFTGITHGSPESPECLTR